MATPKKKAEKSREPQPTLFSLFDMPEPVTPATAPISATPSNRLSDEGPMPLTLFKEPAPANKAPAVMVEAPPVRPVALPPITLTACPVDPVFLTVQPGKNTSDNATYTLLDEAGTVLYSGPDESHLAPLIHHKTIVHYFYESIESLLPNEADPDQPTLPAICLGSWFARFNGQYASTKGDYQPQSRAVAVRVAFGQAPAVADGFPQYRTMHDFYDTPQALLSIWRCLIGNAQRARVLATLFQMEQYYRTNPGLDDSDGLPPGTPPLPEADYSPDNFRMLRWKSEPDALVIQGVPEGPHAFEQCTQALTFSAEPIPIQSSPMGLRLVRLRINL